MIDYLNSRVILSIAAVAITGMVMFASISSNAEISRHCTEQTAENISRLVKIASMVDCSYFESRFPLDRSVFGSDIEVHLNASWVSVQNNGYKSIRVFNAPAQVDGIGYCETCALAFVGSVIVIIATSSLMEKQNHVTIRIEMS